jgi:hypothetical protein
MIGLSTGETYRATLQLEQSAADMVFEVVDLHSIGTQAGSKDATFTDGILTIPVVLVDQQLYSAKLQQLPNTSPMRFQLIQALPQ